MLKEKSALIVTDSLLLFKALEGIADEKYLTLAYQSDSHQDILEMISYAYKSQYIIIDLDGSEELLLQASRCIHYASSECFLIGVSVQEYLSESILKLPAFLRVWRVLSYDMWNLESLFSEIEALKEAWVKPSLVSQIGAISFADIVQMNEGILSTMVLSVSQGSLSNEIEETRGLIRGMVVFAEGKLKMAWSSGKSGIEAFFELLSLKQGEVRVVSSQGLDFIQNIDSELQDLLLTYCVAEDHGTLQDLMGECEAWVESYLHIEDVIADKDLECGEVKIRPYIKKKKFVMSQASCRIQMFELDDFLAEKKGVVDHLLIIYDFSSLMLIYEALDQKLLLGAEEFNKVCKLEWFDEVSNRTLCYWLINEQTVDSHLISIPALLWVGSNKVSRVLRMLANNEFKQVFLLLPQTDQLKQVETEIDRRFGHFCGIFGSWPKNSDEVNEVFSKINDLISEYA
jgi:hypothetical protein